LNFSNVVFLVSLLFNSLFSCLTHWATAVPFFPSRSVPLSGVVLNGTSTQNVPDGFVFTDFRVFPFPILDTFVFFPLRRDVENAFFLLPFFFPIRFVRRLCTGLRISGGNLSPRCFFLTPMERPSPYFQKLNVFEVFTLPPASSTILLHRYGYLKAVYQ